LAGQKENPYKLFWMLGLALTLPMILLSGPIAGYFLGILLIRQFQLPAPLMPVCMILGLLGSGWQSAQLIRKLNKGKED
jgi:hypothetical protein